MSVSCRDRKHVWARRASSGSLRDSLVFPDGRSLAKPFKSSATTLLPGSPARQVGGRLFLLHGFPLSAGIARGAASRQMDRGGEAVRGRSREAARAAHVLKDGEVPGHRSGVRRGGGGWAGES